MSTTNSEIPDVPVSATKAPKDQFDVETQPKQSESEIGEYRIAKTALFTAPGYRAHSAGDHVPLENVKKWGWENLVEKL